MELLCHEITSKEQSAEAFDSILALSRSIFDPDTPECDMPPQNQVPLWESHLEKPNSSIFYVTEKGDSQPKGFFFVIARTQPEIGRELLHIWLAGVDRASQGLGIFPLLTEKTMEHARRCGYDDMTVCTYPERFPKMFRILGQNGWQVVAWPVKDEKVLMKLTL